MSVRWDETCLSESMEILDCESGDNTIVKSKDALNSFKTAYACDPFELGERYYFEVKFIKGSNFKIGIYIDDPDLAEQTGN